MRAPVRFAPAELLASDPLLADTNLLAGSWDGRACAKKRQRHRSLRERRWHLGESMKDFLIDMRRVLKGDEDQVGRPHLPDTPESGRVWRDQLYGGDKWLYDDGYGFLLSRSTTKRTGRITGTEAIIIIRGTVASRARRGKKRLCRCGKNSSATHFLLLFLSQGTPMFLAGDEFGNSQNGNNNAYCQDNEIFWLNWHQLETNRDIYEFVKYMIAFRKSASSVPSAGGAEKY